MAREFTIPPVSFPSSAGGITPSVPHPRRGGASSSSTATVGGPSSSPPQTINSGVGPTTLPFMSFDVSSEPPPTAFSAAPIFPPSASAGSFSSAVSFDDEPPLLEELGINTRQIWRKSASVLNPLRINTAIHEDADLSGPFLFLMAFGLFQLLAGKFHFGIILGWVTVASLFLYSVFNMLAGRNGNLDLYSCFSLVGYCMIPMVIFSALALFVPHGGILIFSMAGIFVLWSTRACTRLLVELSSYGDEHRGLIAYACLLVYMLFSLLVIF